MMIQHSVYKARTEILLRLFHLMDANVVRNVLRLSICFIWMHVDILQPAGKLIFILPIVIKLETDINSALKVHAVLILWFQCCYPGCSAKIWMSAILTTLTVRCSVLLVQKM